MDNSDWLKFLDFIAIEKKLKTIQKTTLKAKFPTFNGMDNDRDLIKKFELTDTGWKKRLGKLYEIFGLPEKIDNKAIELQAYLQQESLNWLDKQDRESILFQGRYAIEPIVEPTPTTPPQIDWYTICNDLFTEHKRQLSSNPLDVKGKSFDSVYVPLGLVERKEKQRPQIDRNLDPSADRGSELYQTETTPIEHDDFLNLVGDRQTGEHIVILGEPGAGKTTLLTRVWQSLLDTNRETPIIIAWISLAAVKDLDLEAYLHHVWLKQICQSTEIDTYWQSFQTLLDRQRVWLLFDGADEMGGDGLTKIQTMLKQALVKSTIRSVVTCRLNLWDASSQNVLKNDFQIFRTLDFKQDLVEAFIVKWFDDDAVAGKKLIAALDETGKERIKDLARNPLRLTLLCNIWRREESLPDTHTNLN
jgi:hypothetical protein